MTMANKKYSRRWAHDLWTNCFKNTRANGWNQLGMTWQNARTQTCFVREFTEMCEELIFGCGPQKRILLSGHLAQFQDISLKDSHIVWKNKKVYLTQITRQDMVLMTSLLFSLLDYTPWTMTEITHLPAIHSGKEFGRWNSRKKD